MVMLKLYFPGFYNLLVEARQLYSEQLGGLQLITKVRAINIQYLIQYHERQKLLGNLLQNFIL